MTPLAAARGHAPSPPLRPGTGLRASRLGRVRLDLRAIGVLTRRDLFRLADEWVHVLVSIAQPMLFLLVLGWGLAPVTNFGAGMNAPRFMYPGAVAMSVTFAAFFSGGSIISDRDHGMLREMLVAPVGRWALAVGKCLGGTAMGCAHAVPVLCLAGLFDIRYTPSLVLGVAVEIAMLAFVAAALGVAIASRTEKSSTFASLGPAVVMPLFALSGAMFPMSGLPGWLAVANRFDPFSYCVDPMRRTLLSTASLSPDQVHRFGLSLTIGRWALSTWVELAIAAGFSVLFLCYAITRFRAAE